MVTTETTPMAAMRLNGESSCRRVADQYELDNEGKRGWMTRAEWRAFLCEPAFSPTIRGDSDDN